MITREDLAYAAGIIDGEGCILIGSQPTRYKGRNPDRWGQAPYKTYYTRISVTTADDTIVPWLYKTFAIGSVCKSPKSAIGNSDTWRWTLSTSDTDKFLRLLLPFLKLKHGQAKIALRFCWLKERAKSARDYRTPWGRGSRATPASFQRQFEKWKQEIVTERSRRAVA